MATRDYSDAHEKSVCKALGAYQEINSGATKFKKGDVVKKSASLLCECKCCMSPKSSVSIKKEWIDKNKDEAFAMRLSNTCIAFNFEPTGDNYYVINERLMKFLVSCLEKEE